MIKKSKRKVALNGSLLAVPGPGRYSLPEAESKFACTFSKFKRFGEELRHRRVPGPGYYEALPSFIRSKESVKSFVFSKTDFRKSSRGG
jgi:hypothetical protein